IRAASLRRNLLFFTACTMVGFVASIPQARAQTTTPVVVPGNGAPTGASVDELAKIKVQYKKNLLKEKDLPSAVTELGTQDIKAVSPTMGSIQTLLKMAPSVQAYSQGPGQSAPTLAVRGIKNDELAETLDGVPLSSFSGGTGDYLSNNIGAPITLN
ncbi:MAG: Plug domain-containing protein, partial [Acidocella sp.]|nr:Plug domain-containing protein [Acidocella sp.]